MSHRTFPKMIADFSRNVGNFVANLGDGEDYSAIRAYRRAGNWQGEYIEDQPQIDTSKTLPLSVPQPLI